mmetsp:Transcript_5623/g.13246  ORF Transcript_5623/g.13246 Transcript_5623/m.13246 type:complete len:204 (-) Transcript_5623:2037-2648(-)
MGIGFFGGFLNFFLSCLGDSKLDIFTNGVVKEKRFLAHQTNLVSKPFDVEFFHVNTLVVDFTTSWTVVVFNQLHYGRLSLTTWTNKSQSFALFHMKIEAFEDLLIWTRWVLKVYVLEGYQMFLVFLVFLLDIFKCIISVGNITSFAITFFLLAIRIVFLPASILSFNEIIVGALFLNEFRMTTCLDDLAPLDDCNHVRILNSR